MLFMTTFTTSTMASPSVVSLTANGTLLFLAAETNAVGSLMWGMFVGLLN